MLTFEKKKCIALFFIKSINYNIHYIKIFFSHVIFFTRNLRGEVPNPTDTYPNTQTYTHPLFSKLSSPKFEPKLGIDILATKISRLVEYGAFE